MKTINIITKNNGVGLFQDLCVIYDILNGAYNCIYVDIEKRFYPKADINIFLELVDQRFMQCAPVNILIPNPEWFYPERWNKYINKFDAILCKTIDTLNIFRKLHYNCIYTSFTSFDRYNENTIKKKDFIHIAGKSSHKNTLAVYECWRNNEQLNTLHFLKHENTDGYYQVKNINYYFERLSKENVTTLLNSCYFHICPSEYEGFGHYINEAKSVGGIIITTDAAPMNEIVEKEYGFFVKPFMNYKFNYGICHKIHAKMLAGICCQVENLTEKELSLMSENSRQSYLDNDLFFKNELKTIIKNF